MWKKYSRLTARMRSSVAGHPPMGRDAGFRRWRVWNGTLPRCQHVIRAKDSDGRLHFCTHPGGPASLLLSWPDVRATNSGTVLCRRAEAEERSTPKDPQGSKQLEHHSLCVPVTGKSSHVGIVGLGPAGIGAALGLTRALPRLNVICIDAGVSTRSKFCSILKGNKCREVQPCQMITGIGGASLLAGGKVSAYPAGRSISNIVGSAANAEQSLSRALKLFREFVPLSLVRPRPDQIRTATRLYARRGFQFRYYDAYRYRQADLVAGYSRMLDEIASAGDTMHLKTQVTKVTPLDEGFVLEGRHAGARVEYTVDRLVLAVGRYGADFIRDLAPTLGLTVDKNHPDVGVRLEFPTALWPDVDSCHNDIKLEFGRSRTFCVCKNGRVAPYRMNGVFFLEGYSDLDSETGLTNLGIVVRRRTTSEGGGRRLLDQITRRSLRRSRGTPVRQGLEDFLAWHHSRTGGRAPPTSFVQWEWGDANSCFPPDVAKEVHAAVAYFVRRMFQASRLGEISVFAPEVDYYWPSFRVHDGFHSERRGVYLVGDCVGQFRGILQAFCSGLVCANHIARGARDVS